MADQNNQSEIVALTDELRALRDHKFLKAHSSFWRLIGFQFVRGLAFGLGSVLGATVLVAWTVYALGHIDFIPIIGDWTAQIIDNIQNR